MPNDQRCECVNANHAGGRCANMAEMHHFCGPCQSEGAVRMTAREREHAGLGSTRSLALWLERHRGHRLAHNVRGFRCVDEPDGQGDRTFLVDAAWNEADTSSDRPLYVAFEAMLRRAERAEKDLRIALSDLAVARDLINASERRCAELALENGSWKRVGLNLTSTIASLRINLADANARAGNDAGEIERLKRLLGGHTCYANATIIPHVCKSPLGNPTPEEAIQQRDAARESLRRLMAAGQSIIDIAKNGMKGERT